MDVHGPYSAPGGSPVVSSVPVEASAVEASVACVSDDASDEVIVDKVVTLLELSSASSPEPQASEASAVNKTIAHERIARLAYPFVALGMDSR